MTTWSIIALVAFMLAFVHARILEGWREQISIRSNKESGDSAIASDLMVSVIVPMRNAAGTIIPLLQDLYAQQYPRSHCEVIVVDDGSTDGSGDKVRAFIRTWPELHLLELNDAFGKKAAITAGVEAAKGELILLTDADVRSVPGRVVALVDHVVRTNADMVIMPVHTIGNTSLVCRVQYEEQIALQGATAGAALSDRPTLANGANMAFMRKSFFEVEGYRGDRWASGDDVFLLQRFVKARKKISYLLDHRVITSVDPEPSWKGFAQQRLRWAGKMRSSRGGMGLISGSFAILLPWLLLVFTIMITRHVSIGQGLFFTATILCGAWALWLFPILRLSQEMRSFFRSDPTLSITDLHKDNRPFFRPMLALIAFLIYGPLFAIASLFVRPKWKGRRI